MPEGRTATTDLAAALILTVPLAIVSPMRAAAQAGDSLMNVTLMGWHDATWLQLSDRNGSSDGRTSPRGFLQRFHPSLDQEYELDLLAARFTLAEDYAWFVRQSGFRWAAGSINKEFLATTAQFKVHVPLTSRLDFGIRWDFEQNYEADRSLVRVGFERRWASGVGVFITGTLEPLKPGADIGAGVRWHGDHGAGAELGGYVLDWANDFIYIGLNAARDSYIDTTLDYRRQPLALRGSARLPLGDRFWVELVGAVMSPTTLWVYPESTVDSGYGQDERAAYAGGLFHWAPSREVRSGAFASFVRTRIDRSPLSPGGPADAFDRREREARLGVFGIANLSSRVYGEVWVAQEWRPESRVVQTGNLPDIDYEDRALVAQGMLVYRSRPGFQADLGILFDRRDVVRGLGQVQSARLDENHYRLRFGVGWQHRDQLAVMIGIGADLDGKDGRLFDGARGRFQVNW